jgi:hypothetical protein
MARPALMRQATIRQRTTHFTRFFCCGRVRLGVFALGSALLIGCATAPVPEAPAVGPAADAYIRASAWAVRSQMVGLVTPTDWTHKVFGDRQPTLYRPTLMAGRDALHAHSAAGNSTLRLTVSPTESIQADRLSFSWFVPALIEEADLKDRDVDDAVARLILSFDGDRSAHFSPRDHMLSELARLVTGEPLPFATLMYVWDNRYPVGTVIPNPHTDRIRQLVIETGPSRLGQWIDFNRDVQADFQHAFGKPPGALHSLGIMTDSNNTGTTADAWYGPITLSFAAPARDSTTAKTGSLQ